MTSALTPYVPGYLMTWMREHPEDRSRSVDGSLVFVDLSGFTKMSERLARHGKAGAEEVCDIISRTFDHLLGAVSGLRGYVLKFGGDAVVCLFEGPDHAIRATAAAAMMRRRLREVGTVETTAGRVRLRMSCGVHSGTVSLYLAGETHRELILTGPAVSETVAMEGTASAGQIVVSRETAALLPARCLGAPAGEGIFLARAPDAGPLAPPQLRAPGFDPAPFVPAAIREHVTAGGIEPEHRQVAIGFVHYDGTDELFEHEGPAGICRRLDETLRAAQAAAAAHDVAILSSDVDADGGKIIFAAGAPSSSGNNEERLLLALRDLFDARPPLPLRAGVNSGHAFAGAVGPPWWLTYTVMGDVMNTAARTMARAEPGEILSTAFALERSQTIFETTAREPFAAKGKAKPIVAASVGAAVGSRRRTGARIPLAGRDRERKALLAALEEARSGGGAAVEISGETGVGKTRLLLELRGECGSPPPPVATGSRVASGTPYGSLREALRAMAGIAAGDDPATAGRVLEGRVREHAPQLLPMLPLIALPFGADAAPTPAVDAIGVAFRPARLRAAVAELLAAVAPRPSVLLVDDAQWLDEASRKLVRALAAAAPEHGRLVVVARREDGDALLDEPAARLTLEPLDPDASAELVRSIAGDVLLPAAVSALVDRAGGSPLFLEELAFAAHAAGGAADGLPESVEQLVVSRLDTLAPADRLLLRSAAVLGTRFDRRLLAAAAGDAAVALQDPGVWDRLSAFVQADEAGGRFRHALYRDAAYEALPYRRRREAHCRVGTVIETGDDAEDRAAELAWHFSHAQDHERTWRYARAAADRAREAYAHGDAVGFLRTALESARRLGTVGDRELAEAWETLGLEAGFAGMIADAGPAFAKALRLVRGDTEATARIMFMIGQMKDRAGRYTEASRWYGRGLRAAEEGGDETARWRHRLLLSKSHIEIRRGRFRQAIALAEQVVESAERTGDRAGVAHAYVTLHLSYLNLGDEARRDYRELPVRVYEEIGDRYALASFLNVLGGEAYFEGRWTDARDLYERSAAAARQAGDPLAEAEATNNLGEILSDQGRLDEAERCFESAQRAWVPAGFRLGVAVALSNHGLLAVRRGRPADAETMLVKALEEFEELGAADFAILTRTRHAEAALASGRHEDAERLAREALPASAGATAASLGRTLARALASRGRLEEAADAFEASLSEARRAGAPFEIAATLEAWRHSGAPRVPRGAGAEIAALYRDLGVVSAATA